MRESRRMRMPCSMIARKTIHAIETGKCVNDAAGDARLADVLDIPTLARCEAIPAEMGVPTSVVCHSRRVAEVAEKLARQLNHAGLHLDVALVRAAALLHDLAKGETEHARAGARMLGDMGLGCVGRVVGSHTDYEFEDARVDEATILYLADKLVQVERIVSLAERFERKLAAASVGGTLPLVRKRLETAQRIAAAVEHILGADVLRIVSTPN